MTDTDVLIIGGGAAGLMAAHHLSDAGKHVTVLEARNRLGGRIHTLQPPLFDQPVEAGAEFIHGKLPLTFFLLKRADIKSLKAGGERWRREDGALIHAEGFGEQDDLLLQRMKALKEDMPIGLFLDRFFPGEEHAQLRGAIKGFAEGYDAADINRASTFALREEWEGEDEQQYRPAGGYGGMVQYLADACREKGTVIHLQAVVERVVWKAGTVEVFTGAGRRFEARRLLITVPLPVLQAEPPARGAIVFEPALHEKKEVVAQMGMGPVIKILLQFKTAVWTHPLVKQNTGADLKKAAWIFSGEPVPTWWTQLPAHATLLTGWMAGPKAAAMGDATDRELLQQALQSLATILSLPGPLLQEQLVASQVCNWQADPFARGAYAYNTVQTAKARKILLQPVEDTLFFAGEALYEGPEMGTVEGALSSGQRAAEALLGKWV